MNLAALVIEVIVATIFIAPALWLAGRTLEGKQKAKFTDAIWIVVLGTVIGAIVHAFVGFWYATPIMFVAWLALIKHFFDCGWLRALVTAIVAVIIFVIIAAVLVFVGIEVPKLF